MPAPSTWATTRCLPTGHWNSTLYADGTYSLTARAIDSADQPTTSAPITVTVDNTAPTVSLTSPVSGAVLSGTATLAASASDRSA